MNKIKGMFHFTAVGYGYYSSSKTPITSLNFTHRIDSISFGKYYPGLENPLDKTQEVAQNNLQNFKVTSKLTKVFFRIGSNCLYRQHTYFCALSAYNAICSDRIFTLDEREQT
jgi:hypothetical protein